MIYSPFDFWNVLFPGIFYQNRTNVSILFVDLPIITIYAKNRQKVTLVFCAVWKMMYNCVVAPLWGAWIEIMLR